MNKPPVHHPHSTYRGPDEVAYCVHVWRGIYTAFDLQHINNPGYNRDRGPVLVPSLRFHLDF